MPTTTSPFSPVPERDGTTEGLSTLFAMIPAPIIQTPARTPRSLRQSPRVTRMRKARPAPQSPAVIDSLVQYWLAGGQIAALPASILFRLH